MVVFWHPRSELCNRSQRVQVCASTRFFGSVASKDSLAVSNSQTCPFRDHCLVGKARSVGHRSPWLILASKTPTDSTMSKRAQAWSVSESPMFEKEPAPNLPDPSGVYSYRQFNFPLLSFNLQLHLCLAGRNQHEKRRCFFSPPLQKGSRPGTKTTRRSAGRPQRSIRSAMERRGALVLELLGSRGCLAPEARFGSLGFASFASGLRWGHCRILSFWA